MQQSSETQPNIPQAVTTICAFFWLWRHALVHVLAPKIGDQSEKLEREIEEWISSHATDLLPVARREVERMLRAAGLSI